jgi:hypothetical protein
MADYILKLYRRQQRHTSPGALIGSYACVAEDSAAAITSLTTDHAGVIADCDYAFIAGPHGRIVWEYGSARDS